MSEDALAEKEAAIAGEELSPAASRVSMAGAALSGRGSAGGPMSQRSMAGAVKRVSLSSVSPITSHRRLDAVSSGSEEDVVRTCPRHAIASWNSCCACAVASTDVRSVHNCVWRRDSGTNAACDFLPLVSQGPGCHEPARLTQRMCLRSPSPCTTPQWTSCI